MGTFHAILLQIGRAATWFKNRPQRPLSKISKSRHTAVTIDYAAIIRAIGVAIALIIAALNGSDFVPKILTDVISKSGKQ